ncbi:hypothetical protein [Nocardia sp. MW-W600-9]
MGNERRPPPSARRRPRTRHRCGCRWATTRIDATLGHLDTVRTELLEWESTARGNDFDDN